MEKNTMLSQALTLTEEEDEMASQVLEIIGGITLEALQSLEKPVERDVWSIEEGDDSVFYSDEDQVQQDITVNASFDFGVKGCRRLFNSVADVDREDDPGEEVITVLQNSEMEKEVTPQVILTEQEEECKAPQTPTTEPMNQSDPAVPGTETNLTAKKSLNTCRESLQLNGTSTDLKTQSGQNISSGEGKRNEALCSIINLRARILLTEYKNMFFPFFTFQRIYQLRCQNYRHQTLNPLMCLMMRVM